MNQASQPYNGGPDSAHPSTVGNPTGAGTGAHEAPVSSPRRGPTLAEKLAFAITATEAQARNWYVRNYFGGARTIATREPTNHFCRLLHLVSWEYGKAAGVDARTALKHLRDLTAAGYMVELKRSSTTCRFTLPHAELVRIGRDCITSLAAEGLPFDDDYMRDLAAKRKQSPVDPEPTELSPDFTDTARAAIAWVLYHHQGGSSPVGQPLRFALGMGAHEPLPDWRIAEAKRYAAWAGATTEQFHATPASDGWMPTFAEGAHRVGDWIGAWKLDGEPCVIDKCHCDIFGNWTRTAPGRAMEIAPPLFIRQLPPVPVALQGAAPGEKP